MSECVNRDVGEAADRVARAREELECAQTADATERARRELDEAVRVLKAARGAGEDGGAGVSRDDRMIPVLGVVE